jgi:magnesium chelatase family protein
MLVAAMNPCPCGHDGDTEKSCRCSAASIDRYRQRISGPLLDRFDMHLWVGVSSYRSLQASEEGEGSAPIRERVEAARQRQHGRLRKNRGIHVNAAMTSALVRRHCKMDEACHDLLARYSARSRVSTRGIERITRLARTIADLRGAERIADGDLVEATGYRYLDEPRTPELEESYGDPTIASDLAS